MKTRLKRCTEGFNGECPYLFYIDIQSFKPDLKDSFGFTTLPGVCGEGRKLTILTTSPKGSRGITTAYNSYRQNQLKVKGTRQKKNANEPAAILDAVAKLTEKIRILDRSVWSVENAALFCSALVELKSGVETWLAAK